MSKDQSYGFVILLLSVVIFIAYLAAFFSPFIPGLENSGWQQWAIGIPVLLFVLLVLVISGWIGWTMFTTPPPAPLEPEPISTQTRAETPKPTARSRRRRK
jgi:cytochrome b561